MNTPRREFLKQGAALALTATSGLGAALSANQGAKSSPMSDHDAVGLAELVRKKQITSLELVEETIRRIERVNPKLNLVLTKNFNVDKARARARQPLGESALAGVPILLKNIVEYKDADIDFGSRFLARLISQNGRLHQANSPFTTAIEAAGMVVTGVTNAPEFGLIETTEPILHGAAHNPWNPAYTTGGSSGGSAASVAAGLVPLAHANDGGGSIRIPACQCGVFGLKPSRNRELTPFTVGGMANDVAGINSDLCVSRSVRDLAAFLNIVEKKNDPKQPPVGFVSGPSSKRLRIGLVLPGVNGKLPDPEVEKAIRATARLCESLKHKVEETKLPLNGEELTDAFLGYWAAGAVGIEADLLKAFGKDVKREDYLEPWTLGLIDLGKKRGLFQAVGRATKVFAAAAAQLQTFFQTYDVLLTPIERIPPYKLGYHNPQTDFATLMNRVLDDVGYTPLHNACGTPAMSVPLYWTKDNLPIGSQFAAWRGGEATLLALAYELEAAQPWAKKYPKW